MSAKQEMAEAVSGLRGKLKLSQSKFANVLDTTVTTVSRLESGKQVPGGPLAVKLVLAGIPVDRLDELFTNIKAEKAAA